MKIDCLFLARIIDMLETDHRILREYQGEVGVTESWLYHVDQTIAQAKGVLSEAREVEKKEAIIEEWNKLDNITDDLYEIAMRNSRIIKGEEDVQQDGESDNS